uniref:Retrotransposon gag domain-containing protein n=1 Tax=Tanacetum cinerariifolium TaxID=118510 RepID=A0A6L2J334_TANCI|nr:hypothetical protein [Tanacetum cinerariifolium]
MADQRTMVELLRAPTEGYAEAIVVPLILAEQFELKHNLINMMTTDQFFGLEKDNPHDHIRWFNKITLTIKYKDVPNSATKLMLFPFSFARAARRWLEKEPPCSIHTWEDLVSKFINEFFLPSRTTNLRNEISNFQQRFDESFHEAWDRYKDLLRACPHHGFTKLHKLDTFYNALNPADQDSLKADAGGNLLERRTQDVLTIIKNKSKVRNSRSKSVVSQVKSCDVNSNYSSEIAKLTLAVNQQTSVVTTAMMVMLKQFQATPPPASVKAVEETCVTCGGAHPYYQCLAAGGNTFPELRDNIQGYVSAAAVNYNQGNLGYRPLCMANQIRPLAPAQKNQNVHLNELEKVRRLNEANMKAVQTQIDMVKNKLRNEMKNSIQTSLSNQINEMKNMMASLLQMNTASTSGTRSLPSNTVANPKGKLKAITTRSEETFTDLDLVEYTIKVPPPPVKKYKPPSQREYVVYQRVPFNPNIHYPSRMLKQKQQEKDKVQFQKFWQMFKQLHINITLADALILMPKSPPPLHDNPLSGSTTYFSSSNPLLEEFADELPPKHDDNLQFDIEFDLKEIEFLLYKDKDSSLKDLIDQKNLANLADIFVDSIPEMFTDEHALDYSSPRIFDEYDDDFLEVESDAENVYDDPFDSMGEKIKESKLLIDELDLPCDFLPPFEYDSFISHDFPGLMLFPQPTTRIIYLTQQEMANNFKGQDQGLYKAKKMKGVDDIAGLLTKGYLGKEFSLLVARSKPRWKNDPGKLGAALDLL